MMVRRIAGIVLVLVAMSLSGAADLCADATQRAAIVQDQHGEREPSLEIVNGSPFEQACARAAVGSVLAAYYELGLEPLTDTPCTLEFCDAITIDGRVLERTLGQYNRVERSIRIVRFDSALFGDSIHLGIDDLEVAYRIVLQHEVAHYVNSTLAPAMHPAADEIIAGYFQFAGVDEVLVQAVVGRWDGLEIRNLSRLSVMSYAGQPQAFQTAGYRYFSEHPALLARCLRTGGPLVRDPFMIGTESM